jgi:hypothetical protein
MHKADHSALCNRVDALLAPYGSRRLSTGELSKLPVELKVTMGWQVATDLRFKDDRIVLNVLFGSAGFEEPAFIALNRPHIAPCEIPHIEDHGKLCVWRSRYIVDLKDVSYLEELLRDAYELLQYGIAGRLDGHFEDEFQSYWAYHCKVSRNAYSLCEIGNRITREVTVLYRKVGPVFADSPKQLEDWLDNRSLLPDASQKKRRSKSIASFGRSLLIHFERTWSPRDFPNRARDLFKLIHLEYGPDGDGVIRHLGRVLADPSAACPTILVHFRTQNGPCLVAIAFDQGLFTRKDRKSIADGFRREIPLRTFVTRISNVGLKGRIVTRFDQDWVLGRDSNQQHRHVATHTVAIIGCGSVGAAIARLLIQSGVTSMILYDGDTFEPENISRHLLGSDCVGQRKAKALAAKLGKEFPNVSVKPCGEWPGEEDSKELDGADVIVSCTAHWYTEQKLLRRQTEETLAPIVFAFVEAHAIAGHVVVNPVDSNAFNSLHYLSGPDIGKMKVTATEWPGQTLKRIPACAGEFQPYGVVPLTHLHALATKTILDMLMDFSEQDPPPRAHVWLGSGRDLKQLGGDWSSDWCTKFGHPGQGNRQVTLIRPNTDWVLDDA